MGWLSVLDLLDVGSSSSDDTSSDLFLEKYFVCAIYSAHDKQLYLFTCQQNETTMFLAPFWA